MSETQTPLLSVVIPVKNGLPYIRETLESLWAQTFQDFEVLVVDDGSTDGTPEWVASLQCPRIRLLSSTQPGAIAAQLTGYHAARGVLIANLDADDVSLPGRFEAQVDFLSRNPSVVAVGTQVRFLVDGAEVRAFSYPTEPREVLEVTRSGRPAVCNPSVMLKTEAARAIVPRIVGPGADLDFYLRLASHGAIANLPDVLHLMRLHVHSMSFSRVAEQQCEIAFAVEADRARRQGQPEPDFEAFQLAWNNRGPLAKLLTALRVRHQRTFRRSVILRARRRHVAAFTCLAAAAALWPPAVAYQLRRKLAALLS